MPLATRMLEAAAGASGSSASGFVQQLAHNHQVGSGLTLILTLTASPAATSSAIAGVRTGSGVALSSVADSRGNTWTVDQSSAASGSRAHLARSAMNVAPLTSGDTITFTFGASTSNAGAAVYEYAGLTASPADAVASGSSSGVSVTTLNAGTTGTTVQASEVAISVVSIGATEASITVPTGYTERVSNEKSFTTGCVALADKTLTATGTESPTWTWPTTGTAGAVVVTYKLA